MKRKKFVKFNPPYPWYTERNIIKAGESAFGIGVRFTNNPFTDQPFKSWWIRGFKRAEVANFDRIKKSMAIQETLALEEVEA